jgi:hypothetical protein
MVRRLVVMALLAAPSIAHAQAPDPTPAVPPSEHASGSAPHTHDGFYMRLGLGAAWGHDSYAVKSIFGPGGKGTISGTGGVFEAAFGGTPHPSWVLGGALLALSFPSPKDTYEGVARDSSNITYTLGVVGCL